MRGGYNTHLPVLNHIFSTVNIKRVIEFGPGNFSTPLFVSKCDRVQCIEMQNEDWFKKIKADNEKYEKFSILCSLSARGFYDLHYIDNVDLVFVDGHVETRPEVINFFEDKAPIIVTHDTEDRVYGWERIKLNYKYNRFDYTKVRPHTSVFTTNKELIKTLETL